MPRGIPNILQLQTVQRRLIWHWVRTPSQAVATYESNGGNITSPRPYGTDPLADDLEKKQTRDEAFRQKFTFEDIFDSVVNRNNGESFQAAFLFYADVSYRLSHSD